MKILINFYGWSSWLIKKYDSCGIRTHASGETTTWTWRLRPLGQTVSASYFKIDNYILEIKLKSMTHIILINLRLVFVFQRSLVRERRVGDIFIKSWVGNLFNWDSSQRSRDSKAVCWAHLSKPRLSRLLLKRHFNLLIILIFYKIEIKDNFKLKWLFRQEGSLTVKTTLL